MHNYKWQNVKDAVLLANHNVYLWKGKDTQGVTIWKLTKYMIVPTSEDGAYKSLTLLLKANGILL